MRLEALDAPVFAVPHEFDYPATFLWALSGGMLAARRGYDITGVVTVALVSSTGGGLLRDGLFLQSGVPALLRSPVYLGLVVAAVALIAVLGHVVHGARTFDRAVAFADAIGLGAYAVVGMQLAEAHGLSVYSMVVVGMTNAVGGGLLRDVLMRREPSLFRPGTLRALVALPACVAYLVLARVGGLPAQLAGWLATATAFALRGYAVHRDIRSRPFRRLVASEPASIP